EYVRTHLAATVEMDEDGDASAERYFLLRPPPDQLARAAEEAEGEQQVRAKRLQHVAQQRPAGAEIRHDHAALSRAGTSAARRSSGGGTPVSRTACRRSRSAPASPQNATRACSSPRSAAQ